MKHRLLRVRELLKREIGDVLRKDFNFQDALVTVNDVDITPDLKQAHIFLGIISKNESSKQTILDELNRKHGHIQKRVSSRVVLKYTAQMHFKLDDSIERGVRLVSLMDGIEIPEDESEDGDDIVETEQ